MPFMPLWNLLCSEFIDVVQRAVRCYSPLQQIRWIRGFTYTLFAKAMVHTWINPYCSFKLLEGTVDKAVAFSKLGLNLLNSEVSMNEIDSFLIKTTVNGMSQPITFAVDGNTPLAALCTKKAGDASVTSRRAHKIPLSTLDSGFIECLQYAFNQDPKNNDCRLSVESAVEESSKFVKNLSPAAKQLFDTFTPRRKRAFEMEVTESTPHSTSESCVPSCSTSVEDEETPGQPPDKITLVRTRKQLFPAGANGVLLRQPSVSNNSASTCTASTSHTNDKCNKCQVSCSRGKCGATQKWTAYDLCNTWYHLSNWQNFLIHSPSGF